MEEKLSPVQPEADKPTSTITEFNAAAEKRRIPDMGNHLILDFVDVDFDLNNYELLDAKLREVLGATSVHIEGSLYKKFDPQGVTIIYLLSESHFSIHTWPESRSCAIDFYHCGPISNQNLIIAEEKLCDAFGWQNCTTGVLLSRGSETSYLANKLISKSEIYKNIKFVHREKSAFQDIRVYDTESLGRILVLDHAIQIASKRFEEDNYTKAMMANVVQAGKNYDHVVIVGGGDLVIATQILKNYPDVKKVTVCEIDERVVEVTQRFFSFAEIVDREKEAGRLEIIIESGAVYMDKLLSESKRGKIGAFIIDCTDFDPDESSIASELFTPEFYRKIFDLLEPNAGFSQHISDMSCLEPFTQRVRDGGFQKPPRIFAAKTPEYGGELPIAYSFKPP